MCREGSGFGGNKDPLGRAEPSPDSRGAISAQRPSQHRGFQVCSVWRPTSLNNSRMQKINHSDATKAFVKFSASLFCIAGFVSLPRKTKAFPAPAGRGRMASETSINPQPSAALSAAEGSAEPRRDPFTLREASLFSWLSRSINTSVTRQNKAMLREPLQSLWQCTCIPRSFPSTNQPIQSIQSRHAGNPFLY